MTTSSNNCSPLLKAKLVYDGGSEVYIPEEMGTPRPDQMQGTPAEQLCELAGRVCYDSLGKGRPSFTRHIDQPGNIQNVPPVEGYHDHILKTNHGSVLEHFNFTVEIRHQYDNIYRGTYASLLNRPGLFVVHDTDFCLRVTANLRSILDWKQFSTHVSKKFAATCHGLEIALTAVASRLAPHIIKTPPIEDRECITYARLVEPTFEDEAWISLFLSGSRGFSHEQVRHGDFTAISQRSTRYVDESEGAWVEHPLLAAWLESEDRLNVYGDEVTGLKQGDDWQGMAEHFAIAEGDASFLDFVKTFRDIGAGGYRHGDHGAVQSARLLYDLIVFGLERWLLSRNVDRATARKQARGAARGYLGNALYTEMIFSASVAQWRRMLKQRCSDAADAEIRLIYNQVLPELQRSRYGERFADMKLRPAKDGIGMVLAEGTGT